MPESHFSSNIMSEYQGQDINEVQKKQLSAYLDMLVKWNKAYNLTSVRTRDEMEVRHLEDSLAIRPYIKGPRILDVGTGAGLPGIPLAITMPDQEFFLLDSNGKKTRFVQQVRLELGLQNLTVVKSRVEDYQENSKFNTITSRAFSSIGRMLDVLTGGKGF